MNFATAVGVFLRSLLTGLKSLGIIDKDGHRWPVLENSWLHASKL